MPDIGSVTARINVETTGAANAARQLETTSQRAVLLGQKVQQAAAEVSSLQQALNAASQAAVQISGSMSSFASEVEAVGRQAAEYSSQLQAMAQEQETLNAITRSGGELTEAQKTRYAQLESAIHAVLVANAELATSSAELLGIDNAITEIKGDLTDAMLKELSAQERLAKAQADTERQTDLTAGSMRRFARIMNVLRHPKYLLSMDGLSFAFQEMRGAAEALVTKFQALSTVAKASIGAFAALAAVLVGGVIVAFKLVNSELAKMGQQFDRLQGSLDAVGLDGLTAQWDQLAERFHLTEAAALTLERQTYGTVRALGFAGDEAIAVTDAMAGLAQKVAQIGGVDPNEAIGAVSGLARGSVDQFEALANVDLSAAEKKIRQLGDAVDDDARAAILLQEAMAQIDQNVDFSNLENEAGAVQKTMADLKGELSEATNEGFRELTEAADNLASTLAPLVPVLGKIVDALSEAVEWITRFAQILVGALQVGIGRGIKLIAGLMMALYELGKAINSIPLLEIAVPDDKLRAIGQAAQALDAWAGASVAIGKYNEGVAVGTEKAEAFAKAIGTLQRSGDLTAESFKEFADNTNQSKDELASSIKYINAHRTELKLTDETLRLVGEGYESLSNEVDDLATSFLSADDAARIHAQGLINVREETQNLKQSGMGLIGSWKSLVEAQAALDKEMSPQNVFAYWQAMDQFQQQAIQSGVEGIRALREQVNQWLAGGDVSKATADTMYSILDEVIAAAGDATSEFGDTADAYKTINDEAKKTGAAAQTGFGLASSSVNDFQSDVVDATNAVVDLQNQMALGGTFNGSINITGGGYVGGGGGGGGGGRGGPVNTSADREGPTNTFIDGVSKATESLSKWEDALQGSTGDYEAMQQVYGRSATSFGAGDKGGLFYPSGGGGGGGGAAASLDDIRKLIQEVNRAIRIGITGTDIGFAGNAIPVGGPDDYLSAEGGGLSIQTLIIKGVWDFTDPAAKRKIIRELEEALKGLKAEV